MMNSGGLKICDKKRKQKKSKRAKFGDELNSSSCPYLPEDLILENIVMRLSARDLAKWSCASKYWYKSILHDSKFVSSHFDHNKNKLNLVFNLLNVWTNNEQSKAYFLSVEEEEEKDDGLHLNYRLLADMTCTSSHELVGHCNGLVCTKLVGNPTAADWGQISIVNPTRSETLSLDYSIPTSSSTHLCHGFCFDSLSQQYKVVFIYTAASAVSGDQEFVSMVLTLGGGGGGTDNTSYAWRKSVTSTAQIAPPPGSTSPFPRRMVTRCSRTNRRSATVSGGDLVWRVTNRMSDGDIDMLLSFDINDEKIRFIRLPTECSLPGTTATTIDDDFQYLVIDHHLLEFKGHLCVARSEKTMIRNFDHRHHYHYRCHRRRNCNSYRKSSFCCCGFKVHLFVLKDKVDQVWIKEEETFELQIKEEQGLLPAPFCCYFESYAAVNAPSTPPTRMLSFSGQLFLYWCDREHLLLYNLQSKHLKVVKCSSSCEKQTRDIFETKRKNGFRPRRCLGDDNNLTFPYMDYQLHAQAENILSLKTFIPQGEETRKFRSDGWDLEQSMEKQEPAGLLNTHRELVKLHAFY